MLQHGRRRRLGGAAIEGRLGCIGHIQLDGLRDLITAQIGGDTKCAINSRGHDRDEDGSQGMREGKDAVNSESRRAD